jgi:hypothetical protein
MRAGRESGGKARRRLRAKSQLTSLGHAISAHVHHVCQGTSASATAGSMSYPHPFKMDSCDSLSVRGSLGSTFRDRVLKTCHVRIERHRSVQCRYPSELANPLPMHLYKRLCIGIAYMRLLDSMVRRHTHHGQEMVCVSIFGVIFYRECEFQEHCCSRKRHQHIRARGSIRCDWLFNTADHLFQHYE